MTRYKKVPSVKALQKKKARTQDTGPQFIFYASEETVEELKRAIEAEYVKE